MCDLGRGEGRGRRWIYVAVEKIASTEGPCDLEKCYVVWRLRQFGAEWGGTCLLFVPWNSPRNFGVVAGNRNQVNRKLLRTFLFVSTWPPFIGGHRPWACWLPISFISSSRLLWSSFGWRNFLWIFRTGSDPTKIDCSCWETGGFSETSVNLYQTTWRHFSEDYSFETWPWRSKISYK